MAKGVGLRDWKIQRITAVGMTIYVIAVVGYTCVQGPLSYDAWINFLSHPLMRVGTPLVIAAMAWHAWIGMWTVFTDYLATTVVLRLFFESVVLVVLLGCVLWSTWLIWSL